MTPRLWVFAGPNGAGKSTIVDHFVDAPMPIINPDNIARTLPKSSAILPVVFKAASAPSKTGRSCSLQAVRWH